MYVALENEDERSNGREADPIGNIICVERVG